MNQTSSFQSTGYNHAQQTQILGTSGLKIFTGQDLTAGDRKRLQQLQSDYWYKQQMQQKQRKKNQQRLEKQLNDQNTLQVNQYRRQLEEQKANRLKQMEIAYKNYNLQQLQEKLYKDSLQRKLQQQEKLNHIDYVTQNDFYTENAKTCQSQLSRNRVKPYHWKGMSQDQRKDILEEQQKQRRQKQLQKQLQAQEEKLFAQQMQAQRKAIIIHERAKTKGIKDVRKGVDQYNKLKAQEMKRKAYHAFDNVHTYKNEG